ncbi:HEAT repeat domain-containing protein [Methanofollis tationis]|uniref:HEAT repeat domain-containing protein n=1 Tax=Methanofollis tationis TaxID=81417 RepID=A0A7K4HLK3_9EURY|nr:HEAT repeat domain-containing protein [Methanofollis tationis]
MRYRAARYLRIRRPLRAFEAVAAALSSEPAAKIRVMLVQALPSIGGRDAIPHLIAASEDADPAVRGAALHALSSFEGIVVDEVTGRAGCVR